jgi:Xaa-Pro aminopeptidase
MFQTFDEVADPSVGPARLALLRAELARQGLTGFIVPRADEHQGEYVPPSAERLKWLTGFSGSAGTAVVAGPKAVIFVDGRYTLQVRVQVDATAFTPVGIEETSPADWLGQHAGAEDRIGYDPRLHTISGIKLFEKAISATGAVLVPVEVNPIDAIWTDRPEAPKARVTLQPIEFAGESVADKLKRLSAVLIKRNATAAILTQPDSIAWAFNMRGDDVPHTPLALSHAILSATGRPSLFIDPAKLGNAERSALEQHIDVRGAEEFASALEKLGHDGASVMVDPAWVSVAIASRLTHAGASLVEGDDPCRLPKAKKNAAEIDGCRAAHLRDGVAMVRFLHWFDRAALSEPLDEIAVVKKLEAIRAETGEKLDGERGRLLDLSFPTIAGSGPNSAIPHYRVSEESNRAVERDMIFLVDSGAQYRDGTTDITRTMIVGEPTTEMRDRFTRVLKGMMAIATLRFPKGTTGHQIDVLARHALWMAGLDFDHGTGHGIGSYLAVHEGPQSIAKRLSPPLESGMILSDEPGFYKSGHWGIRIENLIRVTEPELIAGGERPMHGFETLTLAPIDRRLIEVSLLSPAERDWLNAYHARVKAALTPHLERQDAAWLAQATAAI